MPRAQTLPTRIYATPEYREGYAAGAKAARSGDLPDNPYFDADVRHVAWNDAYYDRWSSRQVGIARQSSRSADVNPTLESGAFAA